jgi:predicted secreted acid phosphatase
MVWVDFGNPYLRAYLQNGYLDGHRRFLDSVRGRLPEWAEASRRAEAAEGGHRPLAAVLDIDEVILCNIHMNSFQAPAGVQGPDPIDFHACDFYTAPDGHPWPRDDLRLNPLLPGARELLEELVRLNIEIFMITGRLESIRDETVENFAYVGLAGASPDSIFPIDRLAQPGGVLIMCPDAEYPPPGSSVRPYKESRRRAIAERYRIVANIGDQVSDLGLFGDVQIHAWHPFYTCL